MTDASSPAPVLTLQQATDLAVAAGFSGEGLHIILAIAQAESGLNPRATNTAGNTPPSTDRGILQINSYWHSEVSDAQAFDPAYSFRWAYGVTREGTDFHQWATYQNGAYLTFMPTPGQGSSTPPMSLLRKLPNVDSLDFSEFWNDPKGGGVRVTGDCGESALAAALVCASPPIESNAQAQALMHSLVDDMIAKGWAGSYTSGNVGSTNMARLRDELVAKGGSYDTGSFVSYQEPLNSTALHDLLLKEAGVRPVVLEIATAGAGLHATNGSHAEAGVHYHFITVLGLYNEGYLCYDGDNSNIWNELPIYPWSAIQAATPCAVMVINMQEGLSVLQVSDTLNFFHTISTNDTAWRCNTTGQPVIGSILAFYRQVGGPGMALQGLSLLGLPLTGELAPDPSYSGRMQVFEKGVICFDPDFKWDKPAGLGSGGIGCYFPHLDRGFAHDQIVGPVQAQLQAQLDKVTADAIAAEKARDAATAQLKQAQADLAAAQKQIVADAAAVAAAKDALAQVSAAQAAQKAAEDRLAAVRQQVQQAVQALTVVLNS